MTTTTAASALRSCARSPARHRPAVPGRARLPSVTATSFRRAASTSTRFAGSSRSSPGIFFRSPLLATSAIALVLTAYWLESEDKARWIDVAQADEPTKHMDLDQSPVHLDPDTKMAFPSTLSPRSLSQLSTPLELVGLGVRTVSFLRVQVYSVGTYFAPEALQRLKGSQMIAEGQGEAIVASLLDAPYDTTIRIVPVKNTDHSHLRDGFVRAMLARLKAATAAKTISDEEAEAAGLSIELFRGFFPTGKVPRGKSLLLIRRGSDGALLLEYEDKLLGTLDNKFLAKELMLAYFADNGKEISSKMKTDVLEGFKRFM